MSKSTETIEVKSRQEWRDWLANNHQRPSGLWLVRYKKHCGDRYLAYSDAVDEALCFGWVDSLPRKLDDDRTMLWMAPRKQGSNWSKVNKDKVVRLTAAGLMMQPGLAKVSASKADGSWDALNEVDNLEIPDDLALAFSAYDSAETNFQAFPPSTRRGILEWIFNAKRVTTRAKRIEETARLAQDNIRANQWRQPKKATIGN